MYLDTKLHFPTHNNGSIGIASNPILF